MCTNCLNYDRSTRRWNIESCLFLNLLLALCRVSNRIFKETLRDFAFWFSCDGFSGSFVICSRPLFEKWEGKNGFLTHSIPMFCLLFTLLSPSMEYRTSKNLMNIKFIFVCRNLKFANVFFFFQIFETVQITKKSSWISISRMEHLRRLVRGNKTYTQGICIIQSFKRINSSPFFHSTIQSSPYFYIGS